MLWPTVFISYRRADSLNTVGRLQEKLSRSFNRFYDLENIPPGKKFRKVIGRAIKISDVMLVIIGPDWASDSRLHDPDDVLRIEIETAKNTATPIIPVLVENASVPSKGDLPESLQFLLEYNFAKVRPDPDFSHDANTLIKEIKKTLPWQKHNPLFLLLLSPFIFIFIGSIGRWLSSEQPKIKLALDLKQWASYLITFIGLWAAILGIWSFYGPMLLSKPNDPTSTVAVIETTPQTETPSPTETGSNPTAAPTLIATTLNGATSLIAERHPNNLLIRFETQQASLDISGLTLQWADQTRYLSLQIWEINYRITADLQFPEFEPNACLLLTIDGIDRALSHAETDLSRCTDGVYETSLPADLSAYPWSTDYLISLNRGQDFPLDCPQANIHCTFTLLAPP